MLEVYGDELSLSFRLHAGLYYIFFHTHTLEDDWFADTVCMYYVKPLPVKMTRYSLSVSMPLHSTLGIH